MHWPEKGVSCNVLRLLLGLCLIFIPLTASVAVMSVDLGAEWMKIAIVSPGVPMEIALNKESKRKTPVAISFRDGEREIGDAALGVGVRFPEATYTHLLELIGKKVSNPAVKTFRENFPYHNIEADPETGTVVFKKDGENSFSVEELLSMILHRAREYAQEFTGQVIKDVVITVPVFFNQAERLAVLRAASLANLKVLQLINANTAVALNYGVFRRKDFNATVQHIMFYDMGSRSTTATIVGYQVVKTKERGFSETNPQLTVLGVGYDRTLGGLEFTRRIRNHLGKLFNEQKKTKNDVFANPRAMSKLWKEAERVKMILSANNDFFAQVEGLLDDKDFRAPINREEFEGLCKDLFERVGGPVEKALKSAAMTMDAIDQVILVGAGTRIPKVQEKLLEVVKRPDLGKNLNTDEAAAMGAVYQAAHLSQGFKVKKFLIKDAVIFPIQVDFERELEGEREGKNVKMVSRTLFGPLNPYPLKKVITFNRVAKDPFAFHVNYGSLDIEPEDIKVFGSLNISRVELTGITAASDKHVNDGSEPKGVKAHFRMDESGVLTLDIVESVFEKIEESPAEPESDMESAFSKLGSTISKLFSGGGGSDEAPVPEPESESTPEPTEEEATPKSAEEESKEGTDDKAKDEQTTTPTPEEPVKKETENVTEEKSEKVNGTQGNATVTGKNDTVKQIVKPKVVAIKETINIAHERLDIVEPLSEQVKTSMKRIEDFNKRERTRKEREEVKNSLEAFILDMQDKLYQTEFESASTEEEREKIREKLSAASDWLYEDGENELETKVFREKLNSLTAATKDLFSRVKEHRDRPEALKALQELVNMSEVFLVKARELSEDDQYFTEVELDTLEKTINTTKEWRKEKLSEQKKQTLHEIPILTVRSIAEKMALLDREVKYLVNKARTSKPKPKKTEKVNETVDDKTNGEEGGKGDAEKPAEETEKTESETTTTVPEETTTTEVPTTPPSTSDDDKHTEL